MCAPESTIAEVAATLPAVLATGDRIAFEGLLAADVRWLGESGGAERHSRAEAGRFYAGLLDSGLTPTVSDITVDDPYLTVLLQVTWAGDDYMRDTQNLFQQFPVERTARLRVDGGLITEITGLAPPPLVELLYFEGCPSHDAFLPHLRGLLAGHAITAPITVTRIDSDEDAQRHRFLGSPTLRVNGRDVDPTASGRTTYGLQCRLYVTDRGRTGTPPDAWILDAMTSDPDLVAATAVEAVRSGDVAALNRLLAAHPLLARARLIRHGGRTLLHVATDWPGHYPDVAATIGALVAAGADPDAPGPGPHPETALHWAASSDDVQAVDALLEAGADIDAPGAVIGGGTPLADATAFGQWAAARRLVERGARTTLWQAAALGLLPRLHAHLAQDHPSLEDITSSFWGACHGGQVEAAAVLLAAGADLNWVGYDNLTPLQAATRSQAGDMVDWLHEHAATPTADHD